MEQDKSNENAANDNLDHTDTMDQTENDEVVQKNADNNSEDKIVENAGNSHESGEKSDTEETSEKADE